MSNRFKIKHLEDLESIRVPPDAIELNPPDPELLVDLFNRFVIEPPRGEAQRGAFDACVLEGRTALLGFTKGGAIERPMRAAAAALLSLGDLRAADDDFAAAARAYLLAIKCAPADPRGYLRLGKLFRRNSGDRLLALYHLHKASELSPDDLEVLFERALCRLLVRDILGGFRDLARLLELAPRPDEIFLRAVHAMTAEGLLKFALILIHYNRDRVKVGIPVDPAEVEELLGPYSSYVHHFAFRGTGFAFEEAIREVARLLLEGAFDDALAALDRLEQDPRAAGESEPVAYRGLLLEAKKDHEGALKLYERYLTGPHDGPVAGVVRARFTELASRLLDSEVALVDVPRRKVLLLIDKGHLFDAIVSVDDDRVLEPHLHVDAGFHEVRVSFLGETRMLTCLFAEGRAYRLVLEGDERRFDCRLEETLPYTLDRAGMRVDPISATLGRRIPGGVVPAAEPAPPAAEPFAPAAPFVERRRAGTPGAQRRRRADREDQDQILLGAAI